jgi:muramoyltetrapeptide carboxypeptidase
VTGPVRPVRAVPPGGCLRIVAPCGVVAPGAIQSGVDALKAAGYRVQFGEHVFATQEPAPYLAGSDADRARDLGAAFLDEGVDGVICARGGYGAMRLLAGLDASGWAPRPLLGFSDVTALHGFLATGPRFASLHGPLLSTLASHEPDALPGALAALGGAPPPALEMAALRDGSAEGCLVGGNLSLVASLAGSRWFPDLRGAVVFLEEIGEPAYRIDRMLTSLMFRGLGEAAGIVIGDMGQAGDRYVPAQQLEGAVRRRAVELLGALGIPVAWGAGFGHRRHNATLPFGTPARLTARGGVARLEMTAAVE